MWHVLLKENEDSSHKLSKSNVGSLDILQNTIARSFAIITKKKGISLNIVKCDFKIDKL
jgi:hypothetical protein